MKISVKSIVCQVYRDRVYRENKPNKILLQKIEKIPKTFVLTRMQHCESPFYEKSVKSSLRRCRSIPTRRYEVKISNPWLKFPTWSSNMKWSFPTPMTEIPYLIEQFLFLANEQKLWFQCHWPYSHLSFQKIFVKLGKIKFKVFF